MEPLELHLPCTPAAARRARVFVRTSLGTAQCDRLGPVAELLATELVTNVVCHAGSEVTVRVWPGPPCLRVEVDDTSTQPPVLRRRDPLEPSGNGIRLVADLATRWGTQLRSDGKTVWFELAISPPAAAVHATD
jgi:hypothetical protein